MLSDHDIVLFLPTAKPDQALAFYRDVLGLPLVEDSPFAIVFRVGKHMLRIQKLSAHTPGAHTVLGWGVGDIRAEIAGLATRGVAFNRYPRLDQDEHGVWTAPGGDQVAWFNDPDGNSLSLTQFAHD